MYLGRHSCGNWEDAIRYEWLVTNELGGFACGTVAGANTRRYHGMLVASFSPPAERTLLVAKLDASVDYLGAGYSLSANEFAGGAVDPRGFTHIETFGVVNGIPTWRYAVGDALLEQQVFMAPKANTTYLRMEVVRADAPMSVTLRPLVTYRDYHAHGRGARPFRATGYGTGCRIDSFAGAQPFDLAVSRGRFAPEEDWYWNFLHREETARGLDDLEDLWTPGVFHTQLVVGQPVYFTATAEAAPLAPGLEVLANLVARSKQILSTLPKAAPRWICSLAQASSQFLVQRGKGPSGGCSIVAGYPWFADWGRDTMIALPGLATALGRYDAASTILRTYAQYVDGGMLPNRFPDSGGDLEYNTADATLWMFHALDDYLGSRADEALVDALFPTLDRIIRAHVAGTRFGIKVDETDGLLAAGQEGTQLTWMDAKCGGRAFTPRIGKAVEVNALWLNALALMTRLAARGRAREDVAYFQSLLQRAAASFGRFWNAQRGCLYDVIDVAGGTSCDDSIRPNQLFAVALPHCVLPPEQMRSVVDTCAQELLTSYGLRSLSPRESAYTGRYVGDPWHRDAAYHQGTAWAWLLGPFVRAHYRVYRDRTLAHSFLAPMAQHLDAACLGTVSEIFDGDPPHAARGCFAQAWSVAEILRSWLYLERSTAIDENLLDKASLPRE